MIIRLSETNQKIKGPMKINHYKINSDLSGTLIEINGKHGKMKCMGEDRIYYIIKGQGKFIIDGKEELVNENDLIFIPKNIPYDIIGQIKFLLICSPEFNPEHDIHLEEQDS